MDGVLSVVLLAGFAAVIGLLTWRTIAIFWPYLLPLVAGSLLMVAGYVAVGAVILVAGFFGGFWLERRRIDFRLRRRVHPDDQ